MLPVFASQKVHQSPWPRCGSSMKRRDGGGGRRLAPASWPPLPSDARPCPQFRVIAARRPLIHAPLSVRAAGLGRSVHPAPPRAGALKTREEYQSGRVAGAPGGDGGGEGQGEERSSIGWSPERAPERPLARSVRPDQIFVFFPDLKEGGAMAAGAASGDKLPPGAQCALRRRRARTEGFQRGVPVASRLRSHGLGGRPRTPTSWRARGAAGLRGVRRQVLLLMRSTSAEGEPVRPGELFARCGKPSIPPPPAGLQACPLAPPSPRHGKDRWSPASTPAPREAHPNRAGAVFNGPHHRAWSLSVDAG